MKRNIIRLMTLCTVAVLALASCKKDNKPQGNVPENGFLATVEANQGNGGRTHLVGTEVQWNAGDQIVVRNGNGTSATFSLSAGENTMNGTFLSSQSGDEFFQPTYTAIYPAADGNSITGEGTATITLPATQAYVANSFANGAMPMMAVSGEQTLEFKNALGGICFPLTGDGLTVTKVVLTSKTNEPLSGVFSADYNNGQPTLSYTSGGSNSITLDCGTGVTLSSTATDFTIMVPAGTLANGFTLQAYYGTTRILNQSTTANPSITRSVISKVNSSLEISISASTLSVTTISPTFISTNSALGIGEVSGGMPSESGVVYALASDLTDPATDLVIGGTGVTSATAEIATAFDAELTGLTSDRIYYVRAYAKNEVGVVYYGNPIPFATRYDYYGLRNGKSRHTFSVSASKQVYFSMGNLQWSATGGGTTPTTHTTADGTASGTWRFAEYQFEYVGDATNGLVYTGGMTPNGNVGDKCNNALIAENYAGWIDEFGWGTSGYHDSADPYNTNYYPYSNSTSTVNRTYNYYGYGPSTNQSNPNIAGSNYDWGVYNAISNGGNTTNQWRTLQADINNTTREKEYQYLFDLRGCTYRYAYVHLTAVRRTASTVGTTVNGMLLFPDDLTSWPALVTTITTNSFDFVETYYNDLTEAEWSLLEQLGCVFLPCSFATYGDASMGYYWASTFENQYGASALYFDIDLDGNIGTQQYGSNRHSGLSVRLVQDVLNP